MVLGIVLEHRPEKCGLIVPALSALGRAGLIDDVLPRYLAILARPHEMVADAAGRTFRHVLDEAHAAFLAAQAAVQDEKDKAYAEWKAADQKRQKEQQRKKDRERKAAHPNYQREWYEKNKDYQNAWRFRNPEKYRWAQQRQLDAGIISAKPLGQINLRHEETAWIVITDVDLKDRLDA